jgi:hypothetical protein
VYITIREAADQSAYSHAHITWLVRTGKVKGIKSAAIWLVDAQDLIEYEQRMNELGTHKHAPDKTSHEI